MAHYAVQIARLIRQVQVVTVEVPDGVDPEKHLSEAYEGADTDYHDSHWEIDPHWGCDEGEHSFFGPTEPSEGEPVIKISE